ncbi:MAG: glycosyltransferase [Pseudomonadota bacterium]
MAAISNRILSRDTDAVVSRSSANTADPRRVTLLLPNLAAGGAEICMIRTSTALLARGFSVDLVLCEDTGALVNEVPPGVRVVALPQTPMPFARAYALAADPLGMGAMLRPVLLPWRAPHRLPHLPALVRYMRAERPDALLSALPTPNLLAVWARRLSGVTTRIITSEHDTLSTAAARADRWRDCYLPPLLGRTYLMADRIVAVSNGVADDLASCAGIPRDRITTVYNPVVGPDLETQANRAVDHPWLAPGAPPVILAAGRLDPQKDFATLIRAFARVRADRDCRLIILGSEHSGNRAHVANLRALPGQLGVANDVDMPGYTRDVLAYMRRAAVFALSSIHEGLGIVLIEALACGTQVVSTDCPHGPSEVLDAGRYGHLVPMGDDESMASALRSALDNPIAPDLLRSRGRTFSIDRAVNQYVELMFGSTNGATGHSNVQHWI